jgi:Rne/Rng family ribonuclease
MKGRLLVINVAIDPIRTVGAALIHDGTVQDLILSPDASDATPMAGDCYWAVVSRRLPNSNSCFVDLGKGQTGFLRVGKGVKEGDVVFVQVTSMPEGGKAAPVAVDFIVKSRRFLLTASKPGVNVSRSIRDSAERARLKGIVEDWLARFWANYESPMAFFRHLKHVREIGIVIRTCAEGASKNELGAELNELFVQTKNNVTAIEAMRAPCLVGGMGESLRNVDFHALHAWTSRLPDEIIVNNSLFLPELDESGSSTGGFGQIVALAAQDVWSCFRLHDTRDLFDHYGIWDEIEKLKSPRVDLPSGAWMAIEATRAMVTVDVNTGGEFGGGSALTANLEAARELPRQLRLRGLGGQIIIDFAPLKKTDRKRIEEALKAAFRKDPIETTLAGWTPLGNFELQRKRERRPLSELLD